MRFAHLVVPAAFAFLLAGGLVHCSSSDTPTNSSTNTGGSGGGGGGSNAPDIKTLAPAAGEVAGWNADPAGKFTQGQLKSGTTKQTATDLIDGSADPFYEGTHAAQAWAVMEYLNTDTSKIRLMIWQMSSVSDSSTLWDDIKNNDVYQGNWQAVTVGDAGRAYSQPSGWFLNTRKGAYFVTMTFTGDNADAGLAAATAFATAIVSKIP